MIFEQKRYSGEEYNELLVALLQSPNVEAEIEYFNRWVSHFNPKFYLLMFREIEKMREAALESNELSQVSAIENLDNKLHELESRLQEDSNVIMAELPDSILGDKKLVEDYLGEYFKKNINEQMWRDFQNCIDDKIASIPKDKELPFLEWCEGMLKMNLVKHNKDCTSKGSCPINSGYDRRIQYIARLIEDATPIPSPVLPHIEIIQNRGNKIQWLGTQKELAELFIRLRAKGWITDFEPETIKDCFTNSNTIDQILKPGEYTEDLGGTFEQVFTPEYVPKFHGVLPNPKRR